MLEKESQTFCGLPLADSTPSPGLVQLGADLLAALAALPGPCVPIVPERVDVVAAVLGSC